MTPEQHAAMMSSATAEWSTPQWLFDVLNAAEPFTLDVCSTKENAKCPSFYTKEDDCFTKPWTGHWWCNPVYGNPELPCQEPCNKKRCYKRGYHVDQYQPGCIDFVRYGIEQARLHNSSGVYLVPARPDTEWFGLLWAAAEAVIFLKGRLVFGDDPNGDPAPFPSALFNIVPKPPSRPLVDLVDLLRLRPC